MPRRRRNVRLLPALAAAALASVLAAAGPAAAAPRDPEIVVQDDAALLHRPEAQVATAMDRLATLGVDRVRLTANWAELTRDPGARHQPVAFDAADPAAYEQSGWRGLDTAVRLARARGLRVMMDIGFYAPVWATSDRKGPRARTDVQPAPYAAFAVAVARRYSGSFVVPPAPAAPADDPSVPTGLLGPLGGQTAAPAPAQALAAAAPLPAIDEVTLWNEPNHPGLLLPQWTSATAAPTSPGVYRRMVRAAYPAIKRVRPGLRVLIGNTSSVGGRPGSGPVPPLRFLRQLACVDRHLRPIRHGDCAGFTRLPGDGWAHHPYTVGAPPSARSSPRHADDVRLGDLPRLAKLLETLARRGRIAPAVRQIHLTEFGYETHPVGNRKGLTQRQQAQWLPWAEYVAGRLPQVVSVAQFLLADQLPAPTRISDSTARPFGAFYTGLLTGSGRPKLAARSFTVGMFVRRRSDGRLQVWGRLRGGPAGRRTVSVQRRDAHGHWRAIRTRASPHSEAVKTFAAGSRSTFLRRTGRPSAHGSYRLIVTGGARRGVGLPTPVR